MARGFHTTSGSASTDKIELNYSTKQAQMTLAFWLRADSTSAFDRLFEVVNGNESLFFQSNKIRWERSFDSTNGQWSTTSSISTDTWIHFVMTYDSGSDANDPVFYLDGSLDTTNENTAPVGSAFTSTSNLIIGNRDDSARAFDGRFAEFARFARILSLDEIEALANGASPAFFEPELYFPFVRETDGWTDVQPASVSGTAVQPHDVPVIYPFSPAIGAPSAASQTVNLGFISSGSALYALDTDKTLDLDFIASSSALYDVSMQLQIDLGFIGSTTALYGTTLTKTIDLGFISSTSALYALDTDKTLDLDFIASTTALYALTPTKTVDLGFIASSSVLYNIDIDKTLDLGFVASTTALYVLTLTKTLDLGFISSTSALYALDTDKTLDLDFIASSSALYTLDIDKTLDLSFIASASALYDVTASLAGAQTINLGFIVSTSILYVIAANNAIIDYDSDLDDYQLYQHDLDDWKFYSVELVDYQLYTSVLEDMMPVNEGTIAKKFTVSVGDDHTGSFTEPDTVTFYLEYDGGDTVAYVYLTDSEVTKHPSLAGVYIFKILATQAVDAYVQAKAVWTSEIWTEIPPLQKVIIQRFIG